MKTQTETATREASADWINYLLLGVTSGFADANDLANCQKWAVLVARSGWKIVGAARTSDGLAVFRLERSVQS